MKLYTKEMFLIAAEKCEVSMIDAEHIMKYIDEYVNAIEFPTDEVIANEAATKFPIKKRNSIWEYNDEDDIQVDKQERFIDGAKWMRDKIVQKQHLIDIMEADQKDGLYDENK